MITVAVDIFGGDHAPDAILAGCVQALHEQPDMNFILTGDADIIKAKAVGLGMPMQRVEIRHAPEVIDPNEQSAHAVRSKENSSLVAAFKAVKQGDAQSVVTAGSTGAALSAGMLVLRRLKGVKRPALAPLLPTVTGGHVLLIDCGANVDCKPQYLVQFAQMGAIYIKRTHGVQNPRVGLINNGAEEHKGDALTRAVYPLLQQADINFIGNVEARHLLTGDVDVLVCDGFVGNVVLKHTEGMARSIIAILKQEMLSDTRSKMGALLLKPAFKRFKKKMDYREHGGALLLGVDGGVIKAHGSSDAFAVKNAILQAYAVSKGHVVEAIASAMAQTLNADGETKT